MMKKFYAAGLIALISLSLYGCATPETGAPVSSQQLAASSAAMSASKTPEQMEATMTFYLPADDGLHIIKKERKVAAGDKTARETLSEMIREDKASQYPLLPAGLSVKGIDIKDGIATVNFSSELQNLSKGSTTEDLFIAMTVDTLTEFPNIKGVKFEIDGQPIQRLTGHKDMTQTFKRDESFIAN